MPWFIYNFPNDATQPGNYTLVSGEPTCTGTRLCAVYATVQPNTDPALPNLSGLQEAISDAQAGQITEGVTKLINR